MTEKNGQIQRVENQGECSNEEKTRRQFTKEQKSEAVKIVEQSGKPISQVAREMGLTKSALRAHL
jgi:transposase